MDKAEQLSVLEKRILKDNPTPQLAAGATQLVFGDGSPDADILLIGEAPGKNEDEQGIPFVGAAGRFLNEMLASIGLNRGDIYITNIVKYRPPANRDPLPEEKLAFLPYLKKQIAIIAPKIIVTLGRHSGLAFLPELYISGDHGQPKRIKVILPASTSDEEDGLDADGVQGKDEQKSKVYQNTSKRAAQSLTQQSTVSGDGAFGSDERQVVTSMVILPLYHPAAALYNGGLRQTLLDDFAKIPLIMKKI